MLAITCNASYVQTRSMATSFLLHALLAAWMLYRSAPAEIMPQQMIAVTIMAAPAFEVEKPQPKPDDRPVETVDDKTQEPEKPFPIRNEKAEVILKQDKPKPHTQPQPKKKPHELAALKPSAGSAPAAKPSMQLAITAPQFDAAYLNNPAPHYPPQAKRRGMQGSVMLGVLVKEDGTAKHVSIEESSGFALLDASAKDAVSRWKFIPARRGSETVEARVMVPIDFRLQ